MTDKKKVRALSPSVLLTYLFVITFVLTGVSFARFGNTKTAEDAARAATFEVELVDVQDDTEIELYLSEDRTENKANFQFKVTSTSEVPVTYDIYVTTKTGEPVLPFGTEMYLTPISTTVSDYTARITNAVAGDKSSGSHTHRPATLQQHKFAGCGVAPAGTYTQFYNLNIHYATVDNVTNSGVYKTSGLISQVYEDISIEVVARDARDYATGNNTLDATDYTDPYAPEE